MVGIFEERQGSWITCEYYISVAFYGRHVCPYTHRSEEIFAHLDVRPNLIRQPYFAQMPFEDKVCQHRKPKVPDIAGVEDTFLVEQSIRYFVY